MLYEGICGPAWLNFRCPSCFSSYATFSTFLKLLFVESLTVNINELYIEF